MPRVSKRRAYITVVILFLINLLNYMDRLTVAGQYDLVNNPHLNNGITCFV